MFWWSVPPVLKFVWVKLLFLVESPSFCSVLFFWDLFMFSFDEFILSKKKGIVNVNFENYKLSILIIRIRLIICKIF